MNTSTLRTGLVFALLQLFFTLTWTVYVIYLPRLVAPNGNPLLFPAITFAWTVTSSALHAAVGAKHWLSGLRLFGLGIAGAIATYPTGVLRDTDPHLPVALASIAVALAAWAMAWAVC